jgi:UDP-N-acetylglucosamine 2-epimerase
MIIEKEIWNLINIEEATKDPLPQLQSNAKLHITHSSGATIEAAEFGVKTILINEIGKNYYAGLIAENKALYIDYDDKDFYDLLKEQIQAVFTSDRNDG